MNSLSSLQSINNKQISQILSTIVTVLNNGFSTPTPATNGTTFVASSNVSSPYTTTAGLPNWTLSLTFPGSYVDVWTRNPNPIYSASYPYCLGADFVNTTGTIIISQNVAINQPGTYTLSFAAFSVQYSSQIQLTYTFASQTVNNYIVPTSSSWTSISLNAAISSSGSYPISFKFVNISGSNVPSVAITAVLVTYLHA